MSFSSVHGLAGWHRPQSELRKSLPRAPSRTVQHFANSSGCGNFVFRETREFLAVDGQDDLAGPNTGSQADLEKGPPLPQPQSPVPGSPDGAGLNNSKRRRLRELGTPPRGRPETRGRWASSRYRLLTSAPKVQGSELL